MVSDRSNGIYRCVIAALAGLILIGASEPPKQPDNTEQSQTAKPQPKGAPAFASGTAKVVEPIKPSKEAEPCGPSRYQSNYDLCAQWKAADSAAEAAKWARWQTIFSALGILGLLYSLHLTRKAVKAAEDASKDADNAIAIAARNADAATDLVRLSEKNSQLELRAYLEFDGVRIDRYVDFDDAKNKDAKGMRFSATVKNHGRTPSENVDFSMGVKCRFTKNGEVVNIGENEIKNVAAIAPSDKICVRYFFHLSKLSLQDVQSYEINIIASLIRSEERRVGKEC